MSREYNHDDVCRGWADGCDCGTAYCAECGNETDWREGDHRDRALHIVKAVNAYATLPALIEALEAYVAAEVPEMQSEHFQERVKAAGPRGAAVVAAYHKALAALAAARETGVGA